MVAVSDIFEDMRVELRGAPREFLRRVLEHTGPPKVWEVLIDGPAGTGKSRGIMHALYALCDLFPGIKILVVRKTRASLSQSFCVEFEAYCCTGDESFLGPTPDHRTGYRYENGSEIVLGGLDSPDKLFSTNYDIVYVQEAFEINETTWEKFYRALRRFHIGLCVLLGDTNPRQDWLWLNTRCNNGKCERLKSTHKDNPKYFNKDGSETPEGSAFMGGLRKLTGQLYKWLYLGEWGGADGLVFEDYSPDRHIVDPPPFLEHSTMRDWRSLGISYFVGGMDFGHTAPGCLQIWGICESEHEGVPNRMYRVAEWYRSKCLIDWWVERAAEAYLEFRPMRAIVADPSNPGGIEAVNIRLGSMVPNSNRNMVPTFCRPADNQMKRSPQGDLAGIDLMRELIGNNASMLPRLLLVRDALRGIDAKLAEKSQPTSMEGEMLGFVYEQPEDGKVWTADRGEKPKADCPDHAIDCARYVTNFSFRRRLHEHKLVEKYKPGTMGYIMRDWEVDGVPKKLNQNRRDLQ